FTLSRTKRNLHRSSTPCGILLCKTSSLGYGDDKQRNITSMSLYKAVSQDQTISEVGEPRELRHLATVSLSKPNLEQVSDGMKVNGNFLGGRATLRVQLSKQTDCVAEYTCEVIEVDSQGKELRSSSRLLQQQYQTHMNGLDVGLTSSLFMRMFSLVQGLDVKLTAAENFLKDKMNSVEAKTLEITSKIGLLENSLESKLAIVEKSSERVEANLNSIAHLWEDRAEDLEKEITERIYVLKDSLQNKAATNFQNIEDKLCHLETKLASIDSDAVQQKVLNTVKDKIEEHFMKLLNATVKADDTLNKTTNLLTSLNSSNTIFQNKIMTNYQNLFDKASKGMGEVFLQNANLTNTIETSLEYLKDDLRLSLDRMEFMTNISINQTISSLQTMEAGLNSSISGEIESYLTDFFMPDTCVKNKPVLLQPASTPYPLIYRSNILGLKTPILCDSVTDNGGWIVIQRRSTGDVDFYKDWVSYEKGFGTLSTDFWLGLENIHAITSSGEYELRIDLKYQGQSKFAHYDRFSLAGKSNNFALTIGAYSGTAGDSLRSHNGMQFSTHDKDNDQSSGNCARSHLGAWWYWHCHSSNLNGKWQAGNYNGPRWGSFTGQDAASFTEMKIRRLG
ncbi:fibrinogen C domain-containing protein 1, partial [Elysia marginata]